MERKQETGKKNQEGPSSQHRLVFHLKKRGLLRNDLVMKTPLIHLVSSNF